MQERAAFLDAICGDDAALRIELETLLDAEAAPRRSPTSPLNHPHIARLIDGGTTAEPGQVGAGPAYFTMEYVEGETITTYCDARHLTIDARLKLFQATCHAVHYAHQNLVVHRDLKPSNILVTRDPGSGPGQAQVKLLDFGVAKLLNPALAHVEVPVTRTLHRLMTPEYAAPEQVRSQAVTTATDVYALGVLLGEAHLSVAASMLDLARVLMAQRRAEEAEPLLRAALAIRARALPEEAQRMIEALRYRLPDKGHCRRGGKTKYPFMPLTKLIFLLNVIEAFR